MTEGKHAYSIATGLAAGDHTIELWRRTEALVSETQFFGFDFGAGGTLLAPPPTPARRIELLGDSSSSGYGIDGKGPNCAFSSPTENEHEAYPALIAIDFGADHHDLSYAGRGVYWNYQRNDPSTYPVIYTRTLPNETGNTWDMSSWIPDLVWITLGGNDWDQPNPGDPAPALATFQSKYDALVSQVRTYRPDAYVVCAVAPSLNDDYPVGYNAYTNMKTALTNVVNARAGAGDGKIFYFEFTRSTDDDDTGCEYHPNPAKHRAMANEADAYISLITGWN